MVTLGEAVMLAAVRCAIRQGRSPLVVTHHPERFVRAYFADADASALVSIQGSTVRIHPRRRPC